MAVVDWPQLVTLALGSGAVAGVTNNLAGGIRDTLTRKGAAEAAKRERIEAGRVRREVAAENAREANIRLAILVRNWLDQEIWDLTTTEDGEPVQHVTADSQAEDAVSAENALMNIAMNHPNSSVRSVARKLAGEIHEESWAVIGRLHEAEHATKSTYEGWRDRIDDLIEKIHVPDV